MIFRSALFRWWLFFGLVVTSCVLLLPDYGTSWDESARKRGGEAKLAYYTYLLGYSDDVESTEVRRDLYPGFFDLSLALIRRVSPFSDIITGHAFSLFFGLLGVLATARLAERLRPGSGLWAAAGLLLYPRYFGHMFINPKDIPFAAMYIVSLWAMVWCLQARTSREEWVRLLVFGVIGGLTAATRIPGVIVFVYFGVALLLLKMWRHFQQQKADGDRGIAMFGKVGLMIGVGALIGFLILLLFWPYLHGDPFARGAGALRQVADFDWEFPVYFWGEYLSAKELPLSYLPTWFLLTTPILFFPVFLAALWSFRQWMLSKGASHRPLVTISLSILTMSIVFPLFFVIFSGATLYNGVRHVLFIVPPTIVLLAIGWHRWLNCEWIRHARYARPAVFVVLAAMSLPVVAALFKLHPYQYTYFNELAGGVGTASRQFESEYWGTSYKEAAASLVDYLNKLPFEETEGKVFSVNMEHPTWLFTPYLPESTSGYTLQVGRSIGESADFYVANTVWGSHHWWAGDVVRVIERDKAAFCVVKDRRRLVGEQRAMYYTLPEEKKGL